MKRAVLSAGLAGLFGVGSASAQSVDINGFLTTSLVGLDKSNITYLNSFTDQPRFDNTDSRLGLQFSGRINERISATAQLLARGRGANDGIKADWAFVAVEVADQTEIRTGKLKFSSFLVSDYIEVGYAYPWIRPPQEVYALNPFSTLVGVDTLYTPTFGDSSLLLQPFVGSNRGSVALSPAQAEAFGGLEGEVSFSAPLIAGLNAVASFPAGSFRVGYLQAEVDQENFGIEGERAAFASAGLSIDWRDMVLYAEYADRDSEEGVMEQAFPDQRAGYVTVGYRFGRFLPHFTYASLDEGADESSAVVLKQTSGTVGLRYDFMDGAALKFEYQRIEPEQDNTGLFSRRLGDDTDSVGLYGVSLDVIF